MRRRVGTIVIAILFLVAGARAFASTNGSLTISGSEQPGDSGVVTISFDGISETVHYGQYSSAASVASAFGAMFSRDFASKLCAHAVGSTILFTLKGEATFGPVTISGSTSSFQVDTSLWPGSLINPPVSLECDPDTVTAGNATSCTASVAVSATGTVSFSLDGAAPFATVSLSSGSASVSNILSGSSVGPHLIAAVYSGDASHSAGGADASVTVSAAPGSLTPATIYSYSITAYAPNGNINGYTDSVNGTWSGITYDSLSRLIGGQQVAGAATQYFCWVYDSFGNRTLQSSAPAAFQSGSPNCTPASGVSATTYATGYDVANHLTSTPFSYPAIDAAGNITSDDTNQYLYDDDGRICAVQGPPAIAGLPATMMQYIYDAEGNRVAKGIIGTFSCDTTSNGFTLTKSYVLDKDGHEVTEMGGDGQWVHTNVYVGGELLATYTDSGVHFHITDWLGNRRVQADYRGRVEETWQNLPFGEMVPNNIHAPLGATSEHFTGKQHDDESGNDYFEARYFGSTMGRFLSPDWAAEAEPVPYASMENPQSLNLYRYVTNSPLNSADADGHCGASSNTSGEEGRGAADVTVADCPGPNSIDGLEKPQLASGAGKCPHGDCGSPPPPPPSTLDDLNIISLIMRLNSQVILPAAVRASTLMFAQRGSGRGNSGSERGQAGKTPNPDKRARRARPRIVGGKIVGWVVPDNQTGKDVRLDQDWGRRNIPADDKRWIVSMGLGAGAAATAGAAAAGGAEAASGWEFLLLLGAL